MLATEYTDINDAVHSTAGFRDDLASVVALGSGRMCAAFVADEANVGSVNGRVRVGFDKESAGGFFDKTKTSLPVVIGPRLLPEAMPEEICGQQRPRIWRSLLRRAQGRTHLSSTISVWLKHPPLHLASRSRYDINSIIMMSARRSIGSNRPFEYPVC